MPSRMLFFTGAPEAQDLHWNSGAGLLDDFDDRILRFLGCASREPTTADDRILSVDTPYWRSVPYERQHLTTDIFQNVWMEDHQGAQFFATSYVDTLTDETPTTQAEHISSMHSVEEVLSQFYEQSYGLHHDVASSQLQAVSQSSSTRNSIGSSLYDTSGSFDTTTGNVRAHHYQEDIPSDCQIFDLKDIPNATHLNAIYPQTLTVNLVVGIISVLGARVIKTRRGVDVKLVELIAGDDTKSGFTINFWLSSSSASLNEASLLDRLRPQDVVLVRNVALSSFRGRVYGQSLRKNVTKIHLLYRKKLDAKDIGGYYRTVDLETRGKESTLMGKTKLVNEWVQLFVAAPQRNQRASVGGLKEILPPDTPPSLI